MKQWQSKKWILFAGRPTSILQRQFRLNWYLWIDGVSRLNLSQVLFIRDDNYNWGFLKKTEDINNHRLVKSEYYSGQAKKRLIQFSTVVNRSVIQGSNPVERAMNCHCQIGPMLVYSHYLERILTRQIQKKRSTRLNKIIKQNSNFRKNVVKLQDRYFQIAYRYLKKKYKNVKDIDFYMLSELYSGKKISAKQIKSRDKFSIQYATKDDFFLYSGNKARQFLKNRGFIKKAVKAPKQIKGLAVFSGKVIGKAKIIRTLSECKLIKPKDIVLTPMTLVQFTPYLKSINALITDEGGINCHAAVTARELKIPCVVGTKIATRVFKDGDRVEVDAIKGVIKKI